MSQFYLNPSRESEAHALPDAEAFFMSEDDIREAGPDSVWYETEGNYTGQPFVPGWYWWACFPGCLPDSDPSGPFDTEADAIADARKDGSDHCFRENNCPEHEDHKGPNCCCCGLPPEDHTGCDCDKGPYEHCDLCSKAAREGGEA